MDRGSTRIVSARWIVAAALCLGGCPDDDGDDGADASGGGTAADSADDDDSADDGGGSAEDQGEGEGEGDGGSGGSGGSGDGSDGSDGAETSGDTGDTGADTSGDTGQPVECGPATCDAGDVCVAPCCGGAPPMCEPAAPDGTCAEGSMSVDASECNFGCEASPCCMPGPCTPPPAYCTPQETLTCDDNGGDNCNVDNCFGVLDGTVLSCQCA